MEFHEIFFTRSWEEQIYAQFRFYQKYSLQKSGVTEDFPFDDETLVMKVCNKMFVLFGSEKPLRINLKCDPVTAIGLREKFKSIIPGYHMHKKHWNTVIIDGSIPDEIILGMIDDSYELVFKGLKKSEKLTLTQTLEKRNDSRF